MTRKKILFEPATDELLENSTFKIHYYDFKFLNRISERYDFTDEWNNLGYGKISNDNTKWSISKASTGSVNLTKVLAEVCDLEDRYICDYCGIIETESEATLWFNREVGPVDGIDFFIVEEFLLNYKPDAFGSEPILSEIPYGYNAAVTMRIDCDEDIASGRQLFEMYKEMNVPFSMAIKTSLDLEDIKHQELITDVISHGGSIVGHSHTHEPNWGGSQEKAKWEIDTSRKRLKKVLPKDYSFDYVVSPFHQNPHYAVKGLAQAGIKGFVGGIIKNDPEYLQSRAGKVSSGEEIITHSQQCMLHGDCYHETGLKVYKEAFSNHYASNTFFGFLDHPFSAYKYGWNSEEERVNAHREFLDFIKSHNNIWFANLIDAMNFLWVKANTKVWVENNELKWKLPEYDFKVPSLKVLWKDQVYKITT